MSTASARPAAGDTWPAVLLRSCAAPVFRLWDAVNVARLDAQVVVHGSYFTGNVGDRAIGLVIRRRLAEAKIRAVLVSRFFTHPPPGSVLVVGGGGVIHGDYRHNLRLRTEPAERARRVIYFAVGCPGLEGLSPEERERLETLDRAEHVSVRDVESAEILSEHLRRSIRVDADPGWAFPRYLQPEWDFRSSALRALRDVRSIVPRERWLAPRSTSPPGRIGLALRGGFDHANLPSLKQELARLASGAELFFIPFAPEDVGFYRRHLVGLDITCLPAAGPVATYRRIEAMDRIVAMRYHSLVFAASAGTPVVALAYARKVWTLGHELGVPTFDVRVDSSPLSLHEFAGADGRAVAQKQHSVRAALDYLEGRVQGATGD